MYFEVEERNIVILNFKQFSTSSAKVYTMPYEIQDKFYYFSKIKLDETLH